MALTRRRVLQVGLGGAALLAVGGVGLALRPGVDAAPSRPLRALDARAFSVLAAFAARVCPADGALPAAADVGVAEAVDALLATCHPGMVAEVRQALLLLENPLAGLLLDGRPRAFTACAPEEQDAVLRAWQTSSLGVKRQVYKALRGLCASAYYANPATYAGTGYPGPPVHLLRLEVGGVDATAPASGALASPAPGEAPTATPPSPPPVEAP